MSEVRLPFFLALIIPYIFTFMTKVWRWRVLFHPDAERVPFGLLFSALMISYIPLPFRAGEVARGIITSTRSGIPAPRVFSTILVEKVLDVLTLLLLLGVSLPFVGLSKRLGGPAIAVGVVVIAVTLTLLALVLRPNLTRKLVALLAAWLPANIRVRVETASGQVLEGLAPLSDPAIAARLGMWSLATWLTNVLTVYLMLLAFNVNISPLAATVVVVAANLSMVVPAAPGNVGTLELAVITVLTALGQTENTAQSFALLYHFIGLVPVAVIGIVAAITQGIGLSAFRASQPATAEATITPSRLPQASASASREKR